MMIGLFASIMASKAISSKNPSNKKYLYNLHKYLYIKNNRKYKMVNNGLIQLNSDNFKIIYMLMKTKLKVTEI